MFTAARKCISPLRLPPDVHHTKLEQEVETNRKQFAGKPRLRPHSPGEKQHGPAGVWKPTISDKPVQPGGPGREQSRLCIEDVLLSLCFPALTDMQCCLPAPAGRS